MFGGMSMLVVGCAAIAFIAARAGARQGIAAQRIAVQGGDGASADTAAAYDRGFRDGMLAQAGGDIDTSPTVG